MDQASLWVGLDTGVLATSVCIIDNDGCIIAEEKCRSETKAVKDILSRWPLGLIEAITIEAGVGTHIVRELRELGFPVQVVEVRKSSKFLTIRRQKTDANDANGLAELGRIGRSIGSGVFVKPLECQNIRTQLNARNCLVRLRVKIDALIQSMARLHGCNLQIRIGVGALERDIASCLAKLADDGINVEADILPLVEIAEKLRAQLNRIDRRFRALANANPVCSLLMTVPGVGPITALSFYSAIGDPFRFSANRDIGPYLGLTPSLHQSGVISRPGRISRFGSKMTRTHLVTAATVLLCKTRKESELRSWGLRLVQRAGLSKARVAVARKMAVIMLRMWKEDIPFNPAHG